MPTLEEFIEDRNTYPDTTKITLADGVESSLGDLRGGVMRQRDYTRKTMTLANQQREFERERTEWETARLQAEAKLTEMARSALTQRPDMSRPELDQYMELDPGAQAVVRQLQAVEQKLQAYDTKLNDAFGRMQQHEQNYLADQHRRVLFMLKQQYPDLNEAEVVDFAKANYLPRLDWAAKLMRYDDEIKSATDKAREEGIKTGLTKAKEEMLQPVLSPRRVVVPETETPATFKDAVNSAMNDPEIRQAILG